MVVPDANSQEPQLTDEQCYQHLEHLLSSVDAPELQHPLGAAFKPTMEDARAFLRLVKARMLPHHAQLYDEFAEAVDDHRRSKSKKKTRKLKVRLVTLMQD